MSINWQLDGDPAPAILVLPPDVASLDEAHAAIELWEFYKRRALDPTQRLTVEVMLATRADGLWAAPTTGREMPRQNGKGDEVEVVELWGLTQRAERILHTVHDAVLLATETQSRLLSMIEGHADLRRLKARAWRGTGQQMIEMRNGGIVWYRTRTGGGARGVDEVDRIVVDEAQHAEEEHLAAITPTQLASANPQLNALGTAAIDGKSAWWWRQRRRALSGTSGRFGYVGHTAESLKMDGDRVVSSTIDVTDRAVWRQANPALVAGRVNEDFFAEQLERLGPAPFAQEHLCVWNPEPSMIGGAVDMALWGACSSPRHESAGQRRYALEVDTNASGETWASIGMSDGTHVELVTPLDAKQGTSWVVPRCVEKKDEIGELLVAKDSPAAALIDDLEAAGIAVRKVKPEEFVQASMQLLEACTQGTLRHIDQPALNRAVAGAARRDVGDGQWRWSRKLASADIGPLCAVSIAKWAAAQPDDSTSIYEGRDMVTLG